MIADYSFTYQTGNIFLQTIIWNQVLQYSSEQLSIVNYNLR